MLGANLRILCIEYMLTCPNMGMIPCLLTQYCTHSLDPGP